MIRIQISKKNKEGNKKKREDRREEQTVHVTHLEPWSIVNKQKFGSLIYIVKTIMIDII